MIKRRDLITLLGGAAAWPIAARGQQMRRIGVFMNLAPDDPEGLVINLNSAKALGLDIPATVPARADEVIE